MGLFDKPDPDEEAIRANERKRIDEERIRISEREKNSMIRTAKAVVWTMGASFVLALVVWGWLGWPTSGPALADGLERVGPPLPDFVTRILRDTRR